MNAEQLIEGIVEGVDPREAILKDLVRLTRVNPSHGPMRDRTYVDTFFYEVPGDEIHSTRAALRKMGAKQIRGGDSTEYWGLGGLKVSLSYFTRSDKTFVKAEYVG